MSTREIRRRLERHRPPRPSDALRRRVLDAAGAAMRPVPRPSLSDRLWFSWPLRVGWAAALVLLIVTQALVVGGAERNLHQFVGQPQQVAVSPAAVVAHELGLEPGGSMRHVPARRARESSDLPAWLD